MGDPFDRHEGEQYESLHIDPSAPIRSQRLLQTEHWRQLLLGALVFIISLGGAVVILFLGLDDQGNSISWEYRGSVYRGGVAGLFVVAGVIFGAVIARGRVGHK